MKIKDDFNYWGLFYLLYELDNNFEEGMYDNFLNDYFTLEVVSDIEDLRYIIVRTCPTDVVIHCFYWSHSNTDWFKVAETLNKKYQANSVIFSSIPVEVELPKIPIARLPKELRTKKYIADAQRIIDYIPKKYEI